MKPTTDGRWAHLACAIWIPGFYDFSTIPRFAQFFSGTKLSAYSSIFVQKHVYQMLKKWNLLMGFLESIRYLSLSFFFVFFVARFGVILY